ncbi:MAG TPA: TOMM precursor leader peptide-binding protein [Candidatus Nanopelagicaceae bacterium]
MTITCTSDQIANIKPQLKRGTLVLPQGERTFVGRVDSGIEVTLPAAHLVLAAMNGKASCQELSNTLELPLEDLALLLLELDGAHLLDLEQTKIAVHTRFHSPNPNRSTHTSDDSSDGAYRQLQSRISPELSFTTWLANVKDGGVSLVSARRTCEISILGDSRISTLLYGILLSSGVSQSSLIGRREPSTIGDQDLCAGYLRPSDIGLSLKTRADELKRELSLFPIASSQMSRPEIIAQHIRVAVGMPPADQLQQWMSEGIPHLLLEDPDCASINIGPLVLPGKTPCWRCISLTKEDQNPIWREIQRQRADAHPAEVPVAVAHHVAGLVALELLRFIDTGESALLGSSTRINYHSPFNCEPTLFARHPACGCTW